jgi:hypothetical protein
LSAAAGVDIRGGFGLSDRGVSGVLPGQYSNRRADIHEKANACASTHLFRHHMSMRSRIFSMGLPAHRFAKLQLMQRRDVCAASHRVIPLRNLDAGKVQVRKPISLTSADSH